MLITNENPESLNMVLLKITHLGEVMLDPVSAEPLMGSPDLGTSLIGVGADLSDKGSCLLGVNGEQDLAHKMESHY